MYNQYDSRTTTPSSRWAGGPSGTRAVPPGPVRPLALDRPSTTTAINGQFDRDEGGESLSRARTHSSFNRRSPRAGPGWSPPAPSRRPGTGSTRSLERTRSRQSTMAIWHSSLLLACRSFPDRHGPAADVGNRSGPARSANRGPDQNPPSGPAPVPSGPAGKAGAGPGLPRFRSGPGACDGCRPVRFHLAGRPFLWARRAAAEMAAL